MIDGVYSGFLALNACLLSLYVVYIESYAAEEKYPLRVGWFYIVMAFNVMPLLYLLFMQSSLWDDYLQGFRETHKGKSMKDISKVLNRQRTKMYLFMQFSVLFICILRYVNGLGSKFKANSDQSSPPMLRSNPSSPLKAVEVVEIPISPSESALLQQILDSENEEDFNEYIKKYKLLYSIRFNSEIEKMPVFLSSELSQPFLSFLEDSHDIDPMLWEAQREYTNKYGFPTSTEETNLPFIYRNPYSVRDGMEQVCLSAYMRDKRALKFLLYDMGLTASLKQTFSSTELSSYTPSGIIGKSDINMAYFKMSNLYEFRGNIDVQKLKQLLSVLESNVNYGHNELVLLRPWICLANAYLMPEARDKNSIIRVLQKKGVWKDESSLVTDGDAKKKRNIYLRDQIDILDDTVKEVGLILEHAGFDFTYADMDGNTALHHACMSGQLSLVKLLSQLYLTSGKDVNTQNLLQRTPLHYCLAEGHVEASAVLVNENQASIQIKDLHGISGHDILQSPGQIPKDAAMQKFNVPQRDILTLPPYESGEFQNGLYSTDSLGNYTFQENRCDIDMIDVSWWKGGNNLFREYIGQNKPVLIRGLLFQLESWMKGVFQEYRKDMILEKKSKFYDIEVKVKDIPYGVHQKFMKLYDYAKMVSFPEKGIVGGEFPWYIFEGHLVPGQSECPQSLVPYELMPTPTVIQGAFETLHTRKASNYNRKSKVVEEKDSREIFYTAQFSYGGKGSGAAVHFHKFAWNALLYGKKEWILYTPHDSLNSNEHVLEFFRHKIDGRKVKRCVQYPGDIVIVPEAWAHGALNVQDSVAIATEAKIDLWGIRF